MKRATFFLFLVLAPCIATRLRYKGTGVLRPGHTTTNIFNDSASTDVSSDDEARSPTSVRLDVVTANGVPSAIYNDMSHPKVQYMENGTTVEVSYFGWCWFAEVLAQANPDYMRFAEMVGAVGPAAEANVSQWCRDPNLRPSQLVRSSNSTLAQHVNGFGGYQIVLRQTQEMTTAFDANIQSVEDLSKMLQFSTTSAEFDLKQRLLLGGMDPNTETTEVVVGKYVVGGETMNLTALLVSVAQPSMIEVAREIGATTRFNFIGGTTGSEANLAKNGFGDYDPLAVGGGANLGFFKDLSSVNTCRFPPSVYKTYYPAGPMLDQFEGETATKDCCTATCFYDITANKPRTGPSRFSTYDECDVFNGVQAQPNIPQNNQVYCATGCGFGIGGCLWAQ